MAVTQDELYAGLDLELSWSERALPEHVRTKHVHRLHPYHGKFIPQLVEVLLALPPWLVLLAALVLPAVEASALVGLVVPGETAVFVAGVVAQGGRLPLGAVIAAAAVGAVVGDQVGYRIGRRWGPGLLDRLPGRLRVRCEQVAAFVAASYDVVPDGAEGRHVDLDAVVGALLTDA